MEHYDWNEGWLFTPRFDPALVRPECGLELEPVRIPHTVRVLPYNYCSENEYQCLCGYRREFFAPREWEGRTVLLTFGAIAYWGSPIITGEINVFITVLECSQVQSHFYILCLVKKALSMLIKVSREIF